MAKRLQRPTYLDRQARRARSAVAIEIAIILARFDPIGLLGGQVNGEYLPEAESILDRLPTCASVEATQVVVHEEFCYWFGSEVCGPISEYLGCSAAIWSWWERRAPAIS